MKIPQISFSTCQRQEQLVLNATEGAVINTKTEGHRSQETLQKTHYILALSFNPGKKPHSQVYN